MPVVLLLRTGLSDLTGREYLVERGGVPLNRDVDALDEVWLLPAVERRRMAGGMASGMKGLRAGPADVEPVVTGGLTRAAADASPVAGPRLPDASSEPVEEVGEGSGEATEAAVTRPAEPGALVAFEPPALGTLDPP